MMPLEGRCTVHLLPITFFVCTNDTFDNNSRNTHRSTKNLKKNHGFCYDYHFPYIFVLQNTRNDSKRSRLKDIVYLLPITFIVCTNVTFNDKLRFKHTLQYI